MSETDPFEPHMPAVDVPAELPAVFAKARNDIANAGEKERLAAGQRCLGILTPGRLLMIVSAPRPGTVPEQFAAQVKALLPAEKPLNITAVSFTALDPLMRDKTKCIPMLGQLLGFAYVGHNVVVFEGHPSALESALEGCDVLWIDSAMLPFLQEDWVEVAYRVMGARPRILVYNRKTNHLLPVVKSDNEQGWRYSEPDGEASYVNCLLTTLAKTAPRTVQVAAGRRVPELGNLTRDPQQLEWIAGLPFRYDSLDADKVIGIIQRVSKWSPAEGATSLGRLQAQLATEGGKREQVGFQLALSQDAEGKKQLDIEKTAPAG
jgi:hypothetical protein